MNIEFWRKAVVLACFMANVMIVPSAGAQATPTAPTAPSPTATSPLPFTSQVKKTVFFLQDNCLHDFTQDAAQLTPEVLKGLPAAQMALISERLRLLLTKLKDIPQSKAKLTPEEVQSLQPIQLEALDPIGMLQLLIKITTLSPLELDGMSKELLALLPVDGSVGTGFSVSYSDPRLPKGQSFHYLVTNR